MQTEDIMAIMELAAEAVQLYFTMEPLTLALAAVEVAGVAAEELDSLLDVEE